MKTMYVTLEENRMSDTKAESAMKPMSLTPWQRHARGWMSACLLVSDLAAFLLAGVLAVLVRLLMTGAWQPGLLTQTLPVVLLCLVVYALRRLYPAVGLSPVDELRLLATSTTAVVLFLAALTFFARNPERYSRLHLGLTWLFSLAAVPLGRAAMRSLCIRLKQWGEPVAMIGNGPQAGRLCRVLVEHPRLGLLPVLRLSSSQVLDGQETSLPVIHLDEEQLNQGTARQMGIQTAILVLAETPDTIVEALVRQRSGGFRRTILIPHLAHVPPFGVSPIHLNGLLGLEVHNNLLNRGEQWLKRSMDIVGALLGMVLLSPLWGLLALLIRLDSKGPVFYRQTRIGKGGRPFQMLKFRTMIPNADQVLADLLAKDPALRREWETYQKLKDDPRITRLGRVLRRFSIDEFPQLWNVLKGEMSLVGPRPFFPEQRALYGDQGYVHYACVRPGITGMWQVSGRNRSEFADRAYWDEYYVRNWSIWLDIYILARTVWVVLRREGAY